TPRRGGILLPLGFNPRLSGVMKVILRNRTSDLYLLGPNMWTNDPERASDFGRTELAVGLANQAGLKHMELILAFNGIRNGLRLPVDSLVAPGQSTGWFSGWSRIEVSGHGG